MPLGSLALTRIGGSIQRLGCRFCGARVDFSTDDDPRELLAFLAAHDHPGELPPTTGPAVGRRTS